MFAQTPGSSPLSAAKPALLRSLLDVGGSLLSQMGTETDSVAILDRLCASLRDLVEAERVSLVVDANADGLGAGWAVTATRQDVTGESDAAQDAHGKGRTGAASEPEGGPTDPAEHQAGCHTAPVRSPSGESLARLQVSWAPTAHRPTDLDRQVIDRFANLANVVVERHMARRRQLQAIAADREMIAGQIHDDPIQTMTAVSLRLQHLANTITGPAEREQLGTVRALTDEAIERLRHVMFSLHPETLVEDGLLASLEAYCDTWVVPEGLRVSLTGDETPALPSEIAMLAFRLTRSAISNVVRHAQATTMTIDVSIVDDHLIATITDDGVGFDVESLAHTAVGHFGIPHARTLAQWAGGIHRIASEPGHGTTVTVDLPIH